MKLKSDNSWLYIIETFLISILFAIYGASNGTNKIGLIAVLLSVFFLLVGDDEGNFDFMVAMIPFQNCWIVGGVSLRCIMCIISIIKLLSKRKARNNVICCVAFMLLLIIEIINDYSHVDIFSFVNTICPLVYFGLFAFIIGKGTSDWNVNKMMNIFIVSSTIACLSNLFVGGGLSSYNNDISWYRLGQESSISLLPGSMEIPIYNCVTIFIIIVRFLYGHNNTIAQKILWGIILVAHFLFGLLTVSRVFVIGILVIVLLLLIWMIKYNKIGRYVKVIPILSVVFICVYIKEHELIQLLVDKMMSRLSISDRGLDNGRTFIWDSCFNYLFSHPKAILIGEGIQYYSILGQNEGYAFSYMAHNFYLDVIMGVGLLGAFCLMILAWHLVSSRRHNNLLAYGILMIIASVFMVSGTLNYIRNYIYIMMGIIFLNNFHTQIEQQNKYMRKG